MPDCDNCKQSVEVENLKATIVEIKNSQMDHEKRLTELERHNDANEERFKTLFNSINEIKQDIIAINSKLDMLLNKPGERWEEIIRTIIVVVTTAAATYFFKK